MKVAKSKHSKHSKHKHKHDEKGEKGEKGEKSKMSEKSKVAKLSEKSKKKHEEDISCGRQKIPSFHSNQCGIPSHFASGGSQWQKDGCRSG